MFSLKKQQRFTNPVDQKGQKYEANNFEVADGLQRAGLSMEKYWDTVKDDKVCDMCRRNEKAGWIPLAKPFPSGHMHPLAHDGCRCALLTRRKGARNS